MYEKGNKTNRYEIDFERFQVWLPKVFFIFFVLFHIFLTSMNCDTAKIPLVLNIEGAQKKLNIHPNKTVLWLKTKIQVFFENTKSSISYSCIIV